MSTEVIWENGLISGPYITLILEGNKIKAYDKNHFEFEIEADSLLGKILLATTSYIDLEVVECDECKTY